MEVAEGKIRMDRNRIRWLRTTLHTPYNREGKNDSKIPLKQAHHLLDFSGGLLKISWGLSLPQQYLHRSTGDILVLASSE